MPDRTTDDFGPFTEQIRGTIDGMGTAEFDALPVGAIQVDGSGVIHRYNRTESRLSGRIPERVIGRNFFTEVAPCTNIPAFSGRFMDGVTSGTLDARFDFVFDFQMAPVRVQIRMQNAGVPDRYWIFVRK
nr:Chain A, Ppr [Rhodospirillum centenum]1MZU_B Chain B, Ppr [Rhodospirillum centenum]1MZU_C Chain C, Ppr [Rhodospirillum centenum]